MAARQAPPVPRQGSRLIPRAPRPLSRRFFARPSPIVARDLLGRLLVRRLGGGVLIGRIVECEAYQQDDAASHSYRGRTPRTEVMFGRPGLLYVYFTYGMHHCMNVVTGAEGEGSAVLLRAAEPLAGVAVMRRNRGGIADPRLLCAGPGRLTQAFAVASPENGLDLVAGDRMFVGAGRRVPDDLVGVSSRIGITVATDKPWRYFLLDSPFVSRRRATAPTPWEPSSAAVD